MQASRAPYLRDGSKHSKQPHSGLGLCALGAPALPAARRRRVHPLVELPPSAPALQEAGHLDWGTAVLSLLGSWEAGARAQGRRVPYVPKIKLDVQKTGCPKIWMSKKPMAFLSTAPASHLPALPFAPRLCHCSLRSRAALRGPPPSRPLLAFCRCCRFSRPALPPAAASWQPPAAAPPLAWAADACRWQSAGGRERQVAQHSACVWLPISACS